MWAAADTGTASQLPARLCGVPAVARAVREESPSPSPLPLQHQQLGGRSILQPLPAWEQCQHQGRQSWHLLGKPRCPCQGTPWAQPTHGGSRRAGGMGWGPRARGSSCWIRPFSTAAVSAPAAGNVHGLGLSMAWPWCIKQTIYSAHVAPWQEWPAFFLYGAGCSGATGLPITNTLSVPARRVSSPQRKDCQPPLIFFPPISVSSKC